MNGACNVKLFFVPAPWGPGEGSKGQISFNFNYKGNFKDFYTNFVCVLTNERSKIYQTGFSLCPLGNAPGWDLGALGVPRGSKKIFFQTWSYGISKRRAEQNASKIFILGSNWWPWGEVKGQISLNFGYHVNFKDFYTKFFVCSHKWKIQYISDRILILSPGSCPRGGTLGHWGYPGGQTIFFFQTWSCSISNRRGWRAEQNAYNIFILGSNWWPWGEVKRSSHVNFKDFYTKLR